MHSLQGGFLASPLSPIDGLPLEGKRYYLPTTSVVVTLDGDVLRRVG